ncbi:hypothetical protein Tco_1032718 [Tanacetum coccineum]|uniref:Uncharacterized protein n=1 Tax=Tanacetum coccineum TaxID=301880 RepID=A0ABQ5GEW7_9ASTR
MAKPILKKYMENAQAESNPTEPITDDNINIELSKEFLIELKNNAYHGMFDEDVVDHIAKGEGKITTWEELVEKFFCKFYPESHDGEDEMLDEGDNWGIYPLEFISRGNSSFENHMKVDGRIKKLSSWIRRRKAYLLEDKQIPSVGVFDEVFNTWMAFGGNTRELGSFGEETHEITDLHQDSPRSLRKPAFVCIAVDTSRETYGYSSVGRFDVFFCDQLLVFQQHQDESLYDSWTRFKDVIQKVLNHGLTEGDLRKFSDIGAWVHVPRCMAWLDYDEHIDSLSTIDNEVGVTRPESTTQTLPSFEEYTPPVTYPKEVEKTLGTPIEVEPLNKIKLEEVGLNYNHNTLFSSREVPSFDGPEPQPLHNSPSLDVIFIELKLGSS